MTNGIPTQAECDPNDPEEMFAWMFVALLGPGSAPIIFPVEDMRRWSKVFYDLGVRHHPELQKIAVSVPGNGADFITGAASARHVDLSEEEQAKRAAGVQTPDTSGLTVAEKRALYEQLHAEMSPEEVEEEDTAEVETFEDFDGAAQEPHPDTEPGEEADDE